MKQSMYKLKFICAVLATASLPVLLANAQEGGCDGPLFHLGSKSGGPCSCANGVSDQFPATPTCGGPIVNTQDWYSCGGDTAQTCDTMQGTIGSSTPCDFSWTDPDGYDSDFQTWFECKNLGGQNCGSPPDACNYGTCKEGTPTDIKANVYAGSDGQCNIAKIRKSSLEEQVVFISTLCHSI